MATVTIYPTRVRTLERSRWSNEDAILADDSYYAVRQAGTSVWDYSLWLDTFSAGLPQDITISAITVRPKAAISSTLAGCYFKFGISFNGKTVVSQPRTTTALTNSLTQYNVGGDLWGLENTKYVKRPFIHGQPNWSISVNVSGSTSVDYYLQYLDVVLTYTLNTSLRGERSVFPVSPASWPYISPSDSIEKKFNGTAPKHQVKSSDINKLGDALYAVQTAVQNSTGYVRLAGLPPSKFPSSKGLPTISVMVTGTWAGGDSIIQHHALYKQDENGTVITNTVTSDLTARRQTAMPFLPPRTAVFSYLTNIQAWVVVLGGGCVPLMAVAEPMYLHGLQSNNGGSRTSQLEFGFTLMNPDGATVAYSSVYSGVVFRGATVTNPNIPAGTVYVKLLGLGGGI